MTKLTTIVTSELPTRVLQSLSEHFDVRRARARPVDDEFIRACEGAFAITAAPGDRFDAAAIGRLPENIRALVSFSVGLDHIDLPAAKARGVIVTNTPGVLTDATADIAMLLILSAARGASRAERMLRNGEWPGWKPSHLFGVDLKGKTLGILGFGRIGRATAERARVFGLRVIFYDHRGLGRQDDYCEAVADLRTFYGACDIVSVHAPSTPQTRKMIDARAIEAMKPGVILINTARGDLVDDEAVIEAARSGRIGALGLDVYNGEPALDPRYLTLPNATLLPHIGSSTEETRGAMGAKVLANLLAVASGEPPPDRVV